MSASFKGLVDEGRHVTTRKSIMNIQDNERYLLDVASAARGLGRVPDSPCPEKEMVTFPD